MSSVNIKLRCQTQVEVLATAVIVTGSVCDVLGVVVPVDDAADGFVVSRTMVDCSNDVVPVRLANTTGNPIYLKKDTVVGICCAACYVKKGATDVFERRWRRKRVCSAIAPLSSFVTFSVAMVYHLIQRKC